MDDLVPKNDEEKKQKGSVDVARLQTLKINIDKAKGKVPEAIRQAYCIVVTVSDKDEVQAFKISVAGEAHFETIKNDSRSRVKDTAITADALLSHGPYNLWKGGETSRKVKDLAGAFAQLPHLPKMLKSQAIVQTLVEGCVEGTFVLKLTRPDRTFRTWWRTQPDDNALKDPAMELVLPEAAELAEIPGDLFSPNVLPDLWTGDEITVQAVQDYFDGKRVVQVDKGGFTEPVPVPTASAEAVNTAINEALQPERCGSCPAPRACWPSRFRRGDDSYIEVVCPAHDYYRAGDPSGELARRLVGRGDQCPGDCHGPISEGRQDVAVGKRSKM